MEFFDSVLDLVGEGIDCVMDGVIAVGEFAEEQVYRQGRACTCTGRHFRLTLFFQAAFRRPFPYTQPEKAVFIGDSKWQNKFDRKTAANKNSLDAISRLFCYQIPPVSSGIFRRPTFEVV